MHRSKHSQTSSVYRRQYNHPPAQKTQRSFLSRVKRTVFFIVLIAAVVLIFDPKVIHAWNQTNAPTYSKKQTVCLDPGHGGVDPGASSADGLITERDINLTVGLKVRSLLNTQGYQVFMTRTTNNVSMDNHARYSYCNSNHATVMVSIHHNFFTDNTVDYDSVLFYKKADEGLANSIVNSTSTELNIPNNGIAQFDDGVLSESKMPAAVSEGFFITNTNEYTLLTEPGSTRLVDEAKGIARGIEIYLDSPAKANAKVGTNLPTLDRTDD